MIRVIGLILVRGPVAVTGYRFRAWRPIGTVEQIARVYSLREMDEIVVLDILARAEGRTIAPDLVAQINRVARVPLTVGGGVRTVEEAQTLLRAGADKVATSELSALASISNILGAQCAVYITHGKHGDEGTRFHSGDVLLIDQHRDGTQSGFDLEWITGELWSRLEVGPLLVCGGAGRVEHVVGAAQLGVAGVACASLWQHTRTTPQEVKAAMGAAGLSVRTV